MRLLALFLFWMVASAASAQNLPLIGLGDVSTTKADTFQIRAVVRAGYVCPPCPKGAMCKPCPGNHITVSDRDSSKYLQIFMDNPSLLKKQQRYLFTLRHSNKAVPSAGTVLIRYSLISN